MPKDFLPKNSPHDVQTTGGGGQRPFEQCSKKLHFSLAMASLITLPLNHHHYYHNHHYHHPHYPHRHHGFTTRPGDCCPSSWDCSLWEARKSNNSMCFFSRSITKRSHRWWCIFCLSSSSHSSLCIQSVLSNQLQQSNISKMKTVFFIIFNVLAQDCHA